MLRLTYISTATRDLPEDAIDTILAISRRNNGPNGVTGLLLYDGRRFLQALEGEPLLVDATYERIRRDGRHRGIVMLSARDVQTRAFGDWSMAARRVAASSGRTISELVDALTAGIEDADLRENFRGFARIRDAA